MARLQFRLEPTKEKIAVRNTNISNEMIAPQLGDQFVTDLIKEYTIISDEVRSANFKKAIECMKVTTIANTLKRIDSLYTERFGVTVKHISSSFTGPAACLSLPPEGFSVLSQDVSTDFYETVERESNKQNIKRTVTDEDIDNIVDITDDNLAVQINKSVKGLKTALNTDGITFDLQRAKIHGLPKDYTINIINDFTLIKTFDLTPEELVAIELHEFGHAWTYLEYGYRSVINTTVMSDTMLDLVRNKNKSPKESLIMAYEKATGDSTLRSIKDKSMFTVVTVALTRLANMNSATHAFTDSEQLADSFSGRFGMSGALASALDKMGNEYRTSMVSVKTEMFMVSLIVILNTILCILTSSALAILLAPVGVGLTILTYRLIFDGERINENMAYDTDIRRLERIKNEIIRNIRTLNLDGDITKKLLKQYKIVDDIVKKTPEQWIGPIEKIGRVLWNSNKVEIKRIEQLTEDLMDNDLYAKAAELKFTV